MKRRMLNARPGAASDATVLFMQNAGLRQARSVMTPQFRALLGGCEITDSTGE
jgi:hypothetical protein